jgi:hypothetical protein
LLRFTQGDPFIQDFFNPQSYNRYSYCINNPLRYTDPTGFDYFGDVGGMSMGYYDAGAGMVTGMATMVMHPLNTTEGVVMAAAHPINTGQAIVNGVAADWNSGARGQGKIVGSALLAIGTALAPGASAGNLAKVNEVANASEKVEQVAATTENAGAGGGRFSGQYADKQKAYRSNVPRDANNNPLPDPDAQGAAHTRLQMDKKDPNRVYSGTEFNQNGQAVKRTDMAGRKGDPLPHEHTYNPTTKAFNKEKIPVQLNKDN